jgi:uncharacterized protein YdaU (DUF1376 family)
MSQRSMPMLPWFADSYIGATRHLTLAERGAYTDLLFAQWTRGPLPADTRRLAMLISCEHKEFKAVWPAIKGKFTATSEGLLNLRLEQHRARSLQLVERRRDGARKTNQKLHRTGTLSDTLSDTPGVTHLSPSPSSRGLRRGSVPKELLRTDEEEASRAACNVGVAGVVG